MADSLVDVLFLFNPVAAVKARVSKLCGRTLECTGQPCYRGAVGWPAVLGLVGAMLRHR